MRPSESSIPWCNEIWRRSERTDPLLLRKEIDGLLTQLFRLPGSEPSHTEDIFETLAYPEML